VIARSLSVNTRCRCRATGCASCSFINPWAELAYTPLTSFSFFFFRREHKALSPLEFRSGKIKMPSHGPIGRSASTTGGFTPAVAQSSHPVDAGFILNTTIFLLAWFALFAVLTWPRLFTRFSRGSEWTRGHLLYHSTKPQRKLPAFKRRPTISAPLESRYEKARVPNSDDNHTNFSHAGLVRREGTLDVKLSLPPHCRSWSGVYQKPSAVLGTQLDEGLSLGRCIILLGYSSVVLFASLYKSNPFHDYLRTGFVSTAQIPIVFALATKNNIIGRFLSMGYEKVKAVPIL